jgi:hypothetical protein
MKTVSKKPGEKGTSPGLPGREKKGELSTDFPLSEKDEVKQAEERLRKSAKKAL